MRTAAATWCGPVVSLMLIAGNVAAQNTGGNTQGQQISALQVSVSNLQTKVAAQQSIITNLDSKLQYVSRLLVVLMTERVSANRET